MTQSPFSTPVAVAAAAVSAMAPVAQAVAAPAMPAAQVAAQIAAHAAVQHTTVPEHDVQEVVARFRQPAECSARSIGSILAQATEAVSDFNAATQGNITFRRVDPLRDTKVTADERLQARLEMLCDILRAKY